MTGGSRFLIVNADDFGLSDGVNRGILDTHREGIVTSTSLMVRAPKAKAAADLCKEFPALSIGLHLDLGEWRFENGEWIAVYERAPLGDAKLVAEEVEAQLKIFSELVGRNPTHIDSHQHAHRNDPVRWIVLEKAEQLGIPVRHFTSGARYCGDFYGQDEKGETFPERVSAEFLSGILMSLPEGTTELCCHPAAAIDFDGTYSTERLEERRTLCDPMVRGAIERAGITLVSR